MVLMTRAVEDVINSAWRVCVNVRGDQPSVEGPVWLFAVVLPQGGQEATFT